MSDPIETIEWIDSESLIANDYNPNIVFSPELKALEKNILAIGWVQPVIATKDKIIVDGFHRTMLSKESKKLKEKYNGKVPCVMFDVPRDEAMILTIRMNRAKGSHVAVRMSSMVKELIDTHKWAADNLATELGATKKEIDLLYQDGVFKFRNIKNYKYSKAWYPAYADEIIEA
jgi:ParB-like chromosome segregation protein Spo0J|tara:strand:- start:1425 stop:1946 length:522 start_codon:yes stop_codon:yes gene_type:complete